MSVNRPTNKAQKEADVNQKLQFYGIAQGKSSTALENGAITSRDDASPRDPQSRVT